MKIRTSRALATTLAAALTAGGLTAVATAPAMAADDERDLTVMTYNIYHGVGLDGALDLGRIAADIRDAGAEVVGLQEVDNNWGERSDFEHQAERPGELLGMNVCYSANLDNPPTEGRTGNRQYGTAILSSYALQNCTNTPLTNHEGGEQRGLAQADIEVAGQTIRFYNTHLTHSDEAGRLVQAQEVARIVAADGVPSVLVGDLNAEPDSAPMAALAPALRDAWTEVGEGDGFTIPVENPDRRIDYVLAERTITPLTTEVVDTMNSDHLPVVTTLRLPVAQAEDGQLRFAMISDIQYADTDTPADSNRYYRDSVRKLQDAAAVINDDGLHHPHRRHGRPLPRRLPRDHALFPGHRRGALQRDRQPRLQRGHDDGRDARGARHALAVLRRRAGGMAARRPRHHRRVDVRHAGRPGGARRGAGGRTPWIGPGRVRVRSMGADRSVGHRAEVAQG